MSFVYLNDKKWVFDHGIEHWVSHARLGHVRFMFLNVFFILNKLDQNDFFVVGTYKQKITVCSYVEAWIKGCIY